MLRFRQKFGRGLRVAYYRDLIRSRILRTPPVTGTIDKICEIHLLTSGQDWLNLIWTLKSFYRVAKKRYALCIHEDGSLTPEQIEILAKHFPDARVITKSTADADVLPSLAPFPRSLEFRKTNHLAPKVFDFHFYLESDRMLLLDSDVLFFSEPAELLRAIEDSNYHLNIVNKDIASAYTVDPAEVKSRTGVNLIERFNSGLGLIHKASHRLEWIEEFLGFDRAVYQRRSFCLGSWTATSGGSNKRFRRFAARVTVSSSYPSRTISGSPARLTILRPAIMSELFDI